MRISDGSSYVCSSDLQIFDGRQAAVAQQRRPIIIGTHLHPALVGADKRPRFDSRVVGRTEIVLVIGDFMTPQSDHPIGPWRSEAHTSELKSLMRISYAVFCLKKKNNIHRQNNIPTYLT